MKIFGVFVDGSNITSTYYLSLVVDTMSEAKERALRYAKDLLDVEDAEVVNVIEYKKPESKRRRIRR